jgi:hypothetical protein
MWNSTNAPPTLVNLRSIQGNRQLHQDATTNYSNTTTFPRLGFFRMVPSPEQGTSATHLIKHPPSWNHRNVSTVEELGITTRYESHWTMNTLQLMHEHVRTFWVSIIGNNTTLGSKAPFLGISNNLKFETFSILGQHTCPAQEEGDDGVRC